MALSDVESKPWIALADGGQLLINKEPGHLRRLHLLELLLELAQQVLGDQLHEHRVISLEGGVDVRVGFQETDPVARKKIFPAASFATGLDGLSNVPGGNGFKSAR